MDAMQYEPDDQDDQVWLTHEERSTWMSLTALTTILPAALDAQLIRDSGLSMFEYTVLAMLSEQEDHTLRMSDLAVVANGSLSRLSHAARRLEGRGFLERSPMPGDGRITIARLTPVGHDALAAAAPRHVRHARSLVFDHLDPTELGQLRALLSSLLAAIDPHAEEAVRRAAEHMTGDSAPS